ncbi:abortive infection system antitoxin AbiGi family protein [Flavobacterium sp. GSP6]|uniref:abortive infection system antitoxin AbiGi family protein n=1 Tax=Flavobacterium sp. GSP6 TaxID=2497488 RepID=UPI000F85E4C3|nr:abortive infection system antitoxin AbiGi family protein [Flavobacterium sp. GSP6]RTZ05707.1 hypothetical protein EKM03_07775 [Flavobacterium sp. GSP6]
MATLTFSVKNDLFPSKEINHIIRYCSELNHIIDNINLGGYYPAYCKENFDDNDLLIPMVSFCNIPIRDVENYMYYGNYGIGFTMEWALKNKLSPVMYVHENSDFLELSKSIDKEMLEVFMQLYFKEFADNILNPKDDQHDFSKSFFEISVVKLNQFNIRIKQFTKPWKNEVEFKVQFSDIECQKIITKTTNSYNEREWRYVPNIENNDFDKFINCEEDGQINPKYTEVSNLEKPHIKDTKYKLAFDLNDVKYIIVNKTFEISTVIETLKSKYNEADVIQNLTNGNLNIISRETIRNDF